MADLRVSGLGGIPKGNTSSRPASPSIGDVYYNGELGQLEIYGQNGWVACSAPPLVPTLATPTNASGSDAYSSTGGKLSIVFTKNPLGGEPTQYNAYTTSGGFNGYSSTNTVTITGLTPGTAYTIYGTTQNSFGTSTNSTNTSAVTPSTKPQAPTIGTPTAGNGLATLTFTEGNTGGSAITNYKYSTDGTTYLALSPAQTTSPLTISGLNNGTTYTLRIKAVNANGDSEASSASTNFTPSATVTVGYLVVAGGGSGGGGGGNTAGGGGAGGLRSSVTATGGGGSLESNLTLDLNTNYTVTVGAGGEGRTTQGTGNNGTNSVFATITSIGGGGGGAYNNVTNGGPGNTGGSGGGAGSNGTGTGTSTNAAGTINQGYSGGTAILGSPHGGGGGGGAGAVGTNAYGDGFAGPGGNGVAVEITGSSVYYAGGGGGAVINAANGRQPAPGGLGGGGTGARSTNNNATDGTANTGGGGGGSGINGSYSGFGGSGVVILRWLTGTATISVGAGLTSDATQTYGSYSYKRFTAGSGNVSFS